MDFDELLETDEDIMEIDENNTAQVEPTEENLRPVALVQTVDLPEVEMENEDPKTAAESTEAKKRSLDDSIDDDGTICPICLDYWTNTGEHRICSLRCGHLFGYKCVQRWLAQGKKICPTCKKKVNKGDMRFIFARKLTAIDTSLIDSVKHQMNTVIEEKNRLKVEVAGYACREHLLNQEILQLKTHLNRLSNNTNGISTLIGNRIRLYMDKSMEVCKYGGGRVFDASCQRDLILASVKSTTSLYSGYGLKKINISTYKPLAFIPVHSLQIRDIGFHPEKNCILTVSMDKTFKVTDNRTNTNTHQFNHQMPLWSCCWDLNNANILHVGSQSGLVIKYDLRFLNEAVSTLTIPGDMSPVVSLAPIPAQQSEILPTGGIIACKLNSVWIFENSANEDLRHSLSLDGPFVSMKYQTSTKQLLVSSRPNSRVSYSRHTLCTLEKKHDKIDCNILHCFQGGGMQKLLSKSCFLGSSENDFVAAYQENCKSVCLWSINDGERVFSVPAHETVLDLKGLQNQNGDFLVSLTEKKLEFFKFY